MNKKQKHELLVSLADKALHTTGALFNNGSKTDISDYYNGQISAFGVSVAMTGLRPALAMSYQEKPNKTKVCKRNILEVIATMMNNFNSDTYAFHKADELLKYVLGLDNAKLKSVQCDIIDCSIAMKQVVRTYNLVPNE